MASSLQSGRLNKAVEGMGDYTLRRTDVNHVLDRHKEKLEGRKIIDARLGDPVVFGFNPNPRFMDIAAEVIHNPLNWGYTNAAGLQGLREVLGRGNPETGQGDYTIHPYNIF